MTFRASDPFTTREALTAHVRAKHAGGKRSADMRAFNRMVGRLA